MTSNHNPLLNLSNACIFALWIGPKYIEIPYVINLLSLVTVILYSSCHYSLTLRKDQALARGEIDPAFPKDAQQKVTTETLAQEDAKLFPIMGSLSLFSLYCAFRFFDKETVNLILSAYFGLIGCGALTVTLSPMVGKALTPLTSISFQRELLIPHSLPNMIGGDSPWDLSYDFTMADVVAFGGSAAATGVYLMKKQWIMNNAIGICFCLQGIEKFSLGTYKIGAILLVGLFFYDIFWVFGTDVMVTVAKSLDGPIKILFPKSLTPDPITQKIELSLLGLGDIVIPGFFLSLLLRFDAHQANLPVFPTNPHASFPKPYFYSGLAGYVLGMATTMFVMIQFEAAQPALLYLVPACLGSSITTAMLRGEWKDLLAYSEEVEEEEEEVKVRKVEKKDD